MNLKDSYLQIPSEISIAEVRATNVCLSPGVYRRVTIPTSAVKRVGDLLADYENGIEVGSLAYVKKSPYSFVRTKAVQDHSNLTQFKGDSVVPITPLAYEKAVKNHGLRSVADGDILYARGGDVGSVCIAHGCGIATISGHLLNLRFSTANLYCYSFLKHPVCKLQQQSNIKGAIRALDNFRIGTLLDCLIPFPNQKSSASVVQYVSALMQAIVDKESTIRDRSTAINDTIQKELEEHQRKQRFQFECPTIFDLRKLKRLDAAIYDHEYKSKIWLVENYANGWETPSQAGFTITPGPSFEIKILGTRIDSDTYKPGYYAVILPTHISIYGTMNVIPYMGTPKKLPLLKKGDVVFGEAGFQKGRSVVLLDEIDKCTTNAHGLYARRTDGDVRKSIFFRCVFNWYRDMRLIDLMAVGGSGGHFSPEYFDFVRIPKFSPEKVEEIVSLYHNPSPPPATSPTIETFVQWHRWWNEALGIWELDREMKVLQRTLAGIQERIIEGKRVSLPFAEERYSASQGFQASLFDGV